MKIFKEKKNKGYNHPSEAGLHSDGVARFSLAQEKYSKELPHYARVAEWLCLILLYITATALPLIALLPHKTVALSALCTLDFILLLVANAGGRVRIKLSRRDILLVLFFLSLLLSGALGGAVSFLSSLSFVSIGSVSLTASRLLFQHSRRRLTAKLFLISSAVVAAVSIALYFIFPTHHPEWVDSRVISQFSRRITAGFGNPNIYSSYLLASLALSLSLLIRRRGFIPRAMLFICFSLNLTALILTYTRGAYIAFALCAAVLVFLAIPRGKRVRLLPLALLPTGAMLFGKAGARLATLFTLKDGSVLSRVTVFRACATMLKDSPLFGIGVGSQNFMEKYKQRFTSAYIPPHGHCLYLEILTEGGILAFIPFMLFVILSLVLSSRAIRDSDTERFTSLGVLCAVLAMLIFGFTDYIFYSSEILYLFFLLMGMLNAHGRDTNSKSCR